MALAALGAWRLTIGKTAGHEGAGAGAAAAGQGGGKREGGAGGRGGGRAAQVTLVAVEPRTFIDAIDLIGVAKARRSVTLTSDATEILTEIRFQSGQAVAAGQTLALLKSDEQKADLVNAKAALARAKADNDRFQELGRRGYATRAALDQYQAAYEQAHASVEAAEARLRDRVIRAPFSGVIGLTDAAPGMLVTPGTPIATLDDLSVIFVDFDLPERFIGSVGEGTPIRAVVDAFNGEVLNGRIERLDTRIKAESRSVTARAAFANPGARLKPGMLLRISVGRGERTALAAPESAVSLSDDRAYVFAVEKGKDGLRAVQKPVLAGSTNDGFVEIREGVEPGEKIIADGLNRLQPGQKVKVGGSGGGRGEDGRGRTQAKVGGAQ